MAESPFKRFGLPAGPSLGNQGRAGLLEHLNNMRTGYAPPAAKLEWGAHLLSIPELDYYVLIERFPDLKSPDHEIKRKAWLKFAKSDASLPYRAR